jgi:hypothetical protein
MALIFYHVPHQNTAGYALNPAYSQAAADTINSKIDSLAAFLPSAWPLYVAKTNNRYDVTTGLSADNIHPNNTGMKQWSLAAADAVNGTPPAPGTIFAQFNPDGSFAGFYAQSEKTGQKNKIAFTTTNGLQDVIVNNPTMTTDNALNGAGYKMSFINFLRLIMDSTKMTPGALVQNGVISAVGPAATIRAGNRGADTTQRGFEWYAAGNKMSWYDEFSNRNMASGDTSLRFGFFTDPTEGNFNSSNLSAAVHIGGNLQGRAGHAPLKMNFGSLMATPEKGAFEPDSLGGGLWFTRKNGIRVRIDSPTVAAGFTNPMTTIGDIIYGGASGAAARLAGNTTATRQFYTSTGTGSAAQAPTLGALQSGDIPNNAANTSGTAANLSGTPALPNGTTVTTQSPGDNTTKPASTAFVAAAIAASGLAMPFSTITTTGSAPSFALGGGVPAGGGGATSSMGTGSNLIKGSFQFTSGTGTGSGSTVATLTMPTSATYVVVLQATSSTIAHVYVEHTSGTIWTVKLQGTDVINASTNYSWDYIIMQ